jgi:enoyl-CoA hydratase
VEYKEVIYQREGNIARITLNRPEKLNTWPFPGQGGLTDDFNAALTEAEEDDDVKVVVIKATGRAFSAGHDLTTVGFVYGMGTGKPGERRPSQRIRLSVDTKFTGTPKRLFYFPKITIAQVHGICYGEGVIVTCCCDLAVAAEDAQFGHVEQRLGFAGSGIPTIPILIQTVGLKRAIDLLLTGRTLSGREAADIGLVNRAVPPERLEEEVARMAEALCLLPRDGIAIGKAHRHLAYDALGLSDGFTQAYIMHTLFTNLRWEEDEYNFFKQRRDKGAKAGFHGRDTRYAGLV